MSLEDGIRLFKDVGVPAGVLLWFMFSFVPKFESRLKELTDATAKGYGEVKDAVAKVGVVMAELVKGVDAIDDKVDEVRRDNTNPRIKREGGK